MNNLSLQEGLRSCQIHTIIKAFFFILFMAACRNDLSCQQQISENDKKIVYLSYLLDEVSLNSRSIDLLFEKISSNSFYDSFQINASEILLMNYFEGTKFIPDNYTIQLFKIPALETSYYLLKFESKQSMHYTFWDTLWLRVSGYTLCDLKIFFDKLQEKGMSVEQIHSMVSSWCKKDDMFGELDWECLLDGYEKGETDNACYLSQKYAQLINACKGCRERIKGNPNAVFSKILLKGDVDF